MFLRGHELLRLFEFHGAGVDVLGSRIGRHDVPDGPPAERVGRDEHIPDPARAADGVAEDVEHVMPVIGEGKGVDDCVESDDCEGQDGGQGRIERVGDERGSACVCVEYGRAVGGGPYLIQRGDDSWDNEWEGEKGEERPDIKHLRQVNRGDVIRLVTCHDN